MPKYGVFSGPYFPAFGLNTGKYGPEKTPYLDTFHTVVYPRIQKTSNRGKQWLEIFCKDLKSYYVLRILRIKWCKFIIIIIINIYHLCKILVRNKTLYTLTSSQYLSLFLIFFVVNPGLCWEKECDSANSVLHGY